MALRRLWKAIKDFVTNRRLKTAEERHKKAADRLDAVVKEMLKK